MILFNWVVCIFAFPIPKMESRTIFKSVFASRFQIRGPFSIFLNISSDFLGNTIFPYYSITVLWTVCGFPCVFLLFTYQTLPQRLESKSTSPPGLLKAMGNHFRHPLGSPRTRLNLKVMFPESHSFLHFELKYSKNTVFRIISTFNLVLSNPKGCLK